MGMDKVSGGGRTPIPMSHRERRDTDRYPRNLRSGEWQAIVDGPDAPQTPRVTSGTYVSPMHGQAEVDPELIRQSLFKLGVERDVLDDLNNHQAGTLARMMLVDDVVTSSFLASPVLPESGVSLSDILDDVGHLITLGSNQWINFFSRSGLLNQRARRFRTTAASLHCATRYAIGLAEQIDVMRIGAIVHTGFKDYPLHAKLQSRFVRSHIRSKKKFNHWTSRMAATIAVPGKVVSHTFRVGDSEDVAFDTHGGPSRTAARETLMGHKVLSLAMTRELRAPVADIVIFGGNRVNQGWFDEMSGAAASVGVQMRLCSIASRGAPVISQLMR